MKFAFNLLVLIAVCSLITIASANMADPMRLGDRMGEPSGELRNIHIRKEFLTLDLRPAERKEPARIEAVYHITNDSAERTVELVFVGAGVERNGYEVLFNGTAVPTTVVTDSTLPNEWMLPDSILSIAPYEKHYKNGVILPDNALRFTLTIPSGEHTITVRYSAAMRKNVAALPVITWYADYILAPAKRWASFGGAEITVYLPNGWETMTLQRNEELNSAARTLTRNGDTLRGTMTSITHNFLSIAFHAPITTMIGFAETGIPILTLLIAFIFLGRFGMRVGRGFADGSESIAGAFFRAAALSVLLTILALILNSVVRNWLLSAAAGDQMASSYDYGMFFGLIMMSPLLVIGSMILIVIFATTAYIFKKMYSVPK